MSTSRHVVSLREQQPATEHKGSTVQSLSADNFPLLNRLSTLTHERPEEFGLSGSLAAFGIEPEALPPLPFTPADPLIVGRPNALDPVN